MFLAKASPPRSILPRGPVPPPPIGTNLFLSRFARMLFTSDTPPEDSRRIPRFNVKVLVTLKSSWAYKNASVERFPRMEVPNRWVYENGMPFWKFAKLENEIVPRRFESKTLFAW